MPDSREGLRGLRLVTRMLRLVSSGAVVIFCLGFLISMHFLAVSLFPGALFFTTRTLIVIAVSTGGALFAGNGEQKRGCLILGISGLVLYGIVSAATASNGLSGVYTIPFAGFGFVVTSLMFRDFSEVGSLFERIPEWRSRPDLYGTDFIRDELIAFDRKIAHVSLFTLGFLGILVATSILVFATTATAATVIILLAIPVIWSASVILIFTRIVMRLKRLHVEGFEITDANVSRPVAYAIVMSIALLVLTGVFASDASPLHYRWLSSGIERSIGYDRSRRSASEDHAYPQIGETGEPGFSQGGPGVASDDQSPDSGEGASADFTMMRTILRYIGLGIAALFVVGYVISALIRLRSGDQGTRELLRRSIHRSRDRLRIGILRLIRIWRAFSRGFREAFARRRRDASGDHRETGDISKAVRSGDDVDRPAERHAVLRWYHRLVKWGEARGIEVGTDQTAAEFVSRLVASRPEYESHATIVVEAFEIAFYSSGPLGRSRMREYVGAVKAIIRNVDR